MTRSSQEKRSLPAPGRFSYWGNQASDEWWINELERFSIHARGGGLTKLLSLKLIGGSALYYSAGVAATAARRYDLLSRLLDARRPNPYRDELELMAVALDADTAYSEAGNHGGRLHSLVRPLLREALALGDGPLDDAWQLFEVLRSAKVLMSHPRFNARLGSFKKMDAALTEAQRKFEEAELAGSSVDRTRQERAEAWQKQGRALGAIADSVSLGHPHLLAADRRDHDGYRIPVAERLASDIAAEAQAHPLLRTQFATDLDRARGRHQGSERCLRESRRQTCLEPATTRRRDLANRDLA